MEFAEIRDDLALVIFQSGVRYEGETVDGRVCNLFQS